MGKQARSVRGKGFLGPDFCLNCKCGVLLGFGRILPQKCDCEKSGGMTFLPFLVNSVQS